MPDPMYRQIADDLRRQIEDGGLPPGSQLRTEIELRDHYGASRNTIRDAIKWLISRGLVETRPGQGTFVIEKTTPFIITLSGDPKTGFGGAEDIVYRGDTRIDTAKQPTRPVRVEIQTADEQMARELGIAEGDTVVCRHQPLYIGTTPWALQTSFYPMWLVAKENAARLLQAVNIEEGTVKYLANELGIRQAGWRDMLIVRAPDENETPVFRLPDDGRVPVLETRRAAFDDRGRPVRLTVTVYPVDRNKFVVNVGEVPPHVQDPTSTWPDTPAGPSGPDPRPGTA
jgi:GntR family transcriptional regulator